MSTQAVHLPPPPVEHSCSWDLTQDPAQWALSAGSDRCPLAPVTLFSTLLNSRILDANITYKLSTPNHVYS